MVATRLGDITTSEPNQQASCIGRGLWGLVLLGHPAIEGYSVQDLTHGQTQAKMITKVVLG